MHTRLIRVGVFYDGGFFSKVSDYYAYYHDRKSRIDISGLHEFVLDQTADAEGIDRKYCQIVDAHYFRGRLSAPEAQKKDSLYGERSFEDVLIKAGIMTHFLPVLPSYSPGEKREKGIDVWLALEAFELAIYKRYDVCVLITGDGDFVPLVRKLNTLGTRVMLLAWDLEKKLDGMVPTRTNEMLIREATYVIMMDNFIGDRSKKKDADKLFLPPSSLHFGSEHGVEPASEYESWKPGKILNIDREKKFGFIKPDNGTKNVHFSDSVVLDSEFNDLKKDDIVEFLAKESEKGPTSTKVRKK